MDNKCIYIYMSVVFYDVKPNLNVSFCDGESFLILNKLKMSAF